VTARTGARTALLVGATGLVGGECLERLLASPRYERVVVVTRRSLESRLAHTGKAEQLIGEFSGLAALLGARHVDHVFCALGTTIRKAGSKSNFREVDFEYPYRLAEVTLRNGASHFSLVSATGASRTSPFFYSRVKGEVEQAIRGLGWASLCIVRPSVIAGQRVEPRPLERLAERALRFAPRQWRPVDAADIAGAMIATALRSPRGVTVIESPEIAIAARKR
jgi:uncharacterized protein YbjT (DUF2867 family)